MATTHCMDLQTLEELLERCLRTVRLHPERVDSWVLHREPLSNVPRYERLEVTWDVTEEPR